MRRISASASARLARPSAWIFITSSKVWMRFSLVAFKVSMSTMPRSDSRATSTVEAFNSSAFLRRSSLVMSVTADWALSAASLLARPSASSIWLFHKGMVFTSVVWIFSIMSISLFCTRRICGAICMATVRDRSRSDSFFSKRLQAADNFCTASASSVEPEA